MLKVEALSRTSPEFDHVLVDVKTAQEHFLSGSSQEVVPGSDEWYMPIKLALMPKVVRRYFIKELNEKRKELGFFTCAFAAKAIGVGDKQLAIGLVPLDRKGKTQGDPPVIGIWDKIAKTIKPIEGMTNEEATQRLYEYYGSFSDGTGLYLRSVNHA